MTKNRWFWGLLLCTAVLVTSPALSAQETTTEEDSQSFQDWLKAKMFEELEGVDIHPAAAVATATLIKESKEGNLPKDAIIMLNITGGGEELFKKNKNLFYLKPSIVFDINPNSNFVKEKILELDF